MVGTTATDFADPEKTHQPGYPTDGTPIASNISEKNALDKEIEYGKRKPSVVASLKQSYGLAAAPSIESYDFDLSPTVDQTHRKLKPRHIQLIGIGGTIGTALYVSIGQGLLNGGPGSLFLAFTLW